VIQWLGGKSALKSQVGVGDGDRTRDIRCHRPTLYQLSYAHQRINRGQFTLKPASIEMGGSLKWAGIMSGASDAIHSATYHSGVRENAEILVGLV
jgi:hypothetical protein